MLSNGTFCTKKVIIGRYLPAYNFLRMSAESGVGTYLFDCFHYIIVSSATGVLLLLTGVLSMSICELNGVLDYMHGVRIFLW